MRVLTWQPELHWRREPGFVRHWLVEGLTALGHQVINVDPIHAARVFGYHGLQRVILAYAQAYRPDMALVLPHGLLEVDRWYHRKEVVDPECLRAHRCLNAVSVQTARALKAMGIPLVASQHEDGKLCAPGADYPPRRELALASHLNGCMDLVLSNCRTATAVYADLGLVPPQYIRQPVPWQLMTPGRGPKRPVIVFAGNARLGPQAQGLATWRIRAVQRIQAAGLPFELYGGGWDRVPGLQHPARPWPDLEDLYRLMGSVAVNLNLPGAIAAGRQSMMAYRNLEVAACGGALVTDLCEELADYFDVERDMATYRDEQEMLNRLKWLLAHPEQAAALGARAREACGRNRLGWDSWLEEVSGRLAAKGIPCDPGPTEPLAPTEPHRTTLASVAGAMARYHEQRQEPAAAAHYYGELLTCAPGDGDALEGLARTAETPEARAAYWHAATAEILDPAHAGEFAGTGYDLARTLEWYRTAPAGTDPALVGRALAIIGAFLPEFPYRLAQNALANHHLADARRTLEALTGAVPELPEPWRLLAEVYTACGQAARAEHARQQAHDAAARLRRPILGTAGSEAGAPGH